ncbi:hypothetical protein [Pareuzebyella sediminis]|uniref:hypothetical protein n=1 Tax=Pareuzebyella sediminis TaxID=2607998 RepID=UPI0011EEB89F|nr:hypothetical protein [Pareuzebyella sediminis]
MFNFKKKNKDEKAADEFFQFHFRSGKDLDNQNQIKKIGLWILLTLLISLIVFGYFTLSKTDRLEKNGEVAKGIVIGLKRNSYKVNDFDGTRVNNYLISFEFFVGGEAIRGVEILEKRDYKQYFHHEIKVNDSLRILYDPRNPKNNRILKK